MRAAPAAVALAALAAACANGKAKPELDGKPLATLADRHVIDVVEAGERLEFNPAAPTPDAAQRAEIDAFAKVYRTLGHGPITISAPKEGEIAKAFAAQVRAQLIEQGVSYAALASAMHDGGESETVVLSFTRYEAEAPDCPAVFEQNLARQTDNRAYDSFGCAMQANLAAMIADPADLLAPRASDPRDGARRADVFKKYREGSPTHALRSEQEQVGVKDLGN